MSRLLLTALALAGLSLLGARADTKPADDPHHGHFMECARACADCMRECESCAHHCANLLADGKKDHFRSMALCIDCGDACAVAGKLAARGGPLAGPICEACAKACDVCGDECKRFPDDEHMTKCAKACVDCAKACRDMLKHLDADRPKDKDR
jgi:hypothetical protein